MENELLNKLYQETLDENNVFLEMEYTRAEFRSMCNRIINDNPNGEFIMLKYAANLKLKELIRNSR